MVPLPQCQFLRYKDNHYDYFLVLYFFRSDCHLRIQKTLLPTKIASAAILYKGQSSYPVLFRCEVDFSVLLFVFLSTEKSLRRPFWVLIRIHNASLCFVPRNQEISVDFKSEQGCQILSTNVLPQRDNAVRKNFRVSFTGDHLSVPVVCQNEVPYDPIKKKGLFSSSMNQNLHFADENEPDIRRGSIIRHHNIC